MTRSVWRKRFKITGLVLSIMMIGVWVFSMMFETRYSPRRQWYTSLVYGRISYQGWQTKPPGWICRPNYSIWKTLLPQMHWTFFAENILGFGLPIKNASGVHIPVWLFVVATGFPTAFLWWRDRRPKAGLCMVCKYDLTGNISGICPECGTAMK